MKHIILGTAGHIDHGKTSLIKALTGIDCDRLKEEKTRGITIELGFANLDLKNGTRIGIIDVPGHERFVHHMVAGVVGMDLVILVIAADEGIMPQTREHLDICRLLGVKKGLVALTKADVVDHEWLELVKEEVKDFIQGTFLNVAPIIPVSSVTCEGLDKLMNAIADLSRDIPEHTGEGVFRLPVDRVFTMKGFGTVVTGTLLSGEVRTGDTVEIFPQKLKVRVRGIQVHNEKVDIVSAGQRTAINLQGLDKEAVSRGDVICQPGLMEPGYLIDARLALLDSVLPLKNRTRIRFHTGTAEILGRIILLDRDELKPGDACLVQFRLERKAAVMPKDRYIIRRYSPIITLGGGDIIDSHPEKHKRYKQDVMEDIATLEGSSIPETIEFYVRKAGENGIDMKSLMARTNMDIETISSVLDILKKEGKILVVDEASRRVVHLSSYHELQGRLKDALESFHSRNPLKWGMSKEELKARVSPFLDPRIYNIALDDLVKRSDIIVQQETCAIAGHQVSLSGEDQKIREEILNMFKKAGLQPPNIEEVSTLLKKERKRVEMLINLLIDEDMLKRLKDGLLFHTGALSSLAVQVQSFLKDGRQMGIGDFKDLTGVSRKYAVPLLEYMDNQGITIRLGDKRAIRKKV
ncbi:selenocysteine-specific translation elongation factor [bacterium]|nr:selenocysteine-specific translation elongation factor [bacterium]